MYHQRPASMHGGGPPPAKRQKSSAVVTRYPPPPGYVPPYAHGTQQPWQPGAFSPAYPATGQNGYHPQTYPSTYPAAPPVYPANPPSGYYGQEVSGFSQSGPATYPGHTPVANGWQQPMTYPPPQMHGPPNWQPGVTANTPDHAAQQSYPHQPHQPHVPSPAQYGFPTPVSTLGIAPSQSISGQHPPKPRQPSNTSWQSKTRASSASHSVTADPVADDHDPLAHEFDEADYTREFSFAKDQDGFSEDLSIGVIVYHPARPTKIALLATFDEAEADILNPSDRADDDPVSRFFTKRSMGEVGTSVRLSDRWDQVREDLILRDFSPTSAAVYVPLESVKAERNRPDRVASERDVESVETEDKVSSTIAPQLSEQSRDFKAITERKSPGASEIAQTANPEEIESDGDDEAMDTDSDSDEDQDVAADLSNEAKEQPEERPKNSDLEQKQTFDDNGSPPTAQREQHTTQTNGSGRNEQDAGHVGVFNKLAATPRPHQPQYPHQQPRRPSSGMSNGHHDERRLPHAQMPYGPHNVPPPPTQVEAFDPWQAGDSQIDGLRHSHSPRSAASHNTIPGGDYESHLDEQEQRSHTKEVNANQGSAKKRGYDEMEQPNGDERRRQYDDVTPRLQRHRPKVPDAYSRRYR